MNEQPDGRPERAQAERPGSRQARLDEQAQARPSLTTEVRRRRTDQAFFLRLRDAIQQNHKALERLGT